MKIASKKALTLMVSLLLFVFIATIVGLKPLADSSVGSSDAVESAISSTEMSTDETTSETASEVESEAAVEDTSDGLSEGYSDEGLVSFSTRAFVTKNEQFTSYDANFATDVGTGGETLSSRLPSYGNAGGGIYNPSPTNWDPYTSLNTTTGTHFQLPSVGRDGGNNNFYSYYEFYYTSNAADCAALGNALNQLYPTCYTDFRTFTLAAIGPTSNAQYVMVEDVRNFLSSAAPGGFWQKYNNYLTLNASLIGSSTRTYFDDSQLQGLENAYGSLTIGYSVVPGGKNYYLDITSDESIGLKRNNVWYYLLGYTGTGTTINIFGASGGSAIWGNVPTILSSDFDVPVFSTPIVGWGTGATGTQLYDGINTNIRIAGGEQTTVAGFWGPRGGTLGGRNYQRAGTNIGTVTINSYVGSSGRPNTGQEFQIDAFGGNLVVPTLADFSAIRFGGFNDQLSAYTSPGDVTLPDYLAQSDLSSRPFRIIASPAMFGVYQGLSAGIATTHTAREIYFSGTATTTSPSASSPLIIAPTQSGATVKLAPNITWLDCSADSWADSSGINQDPWHCYTFTGTALGATVGTAPTIRKSFIFSGATEKSDVTLKPGAMANTGTAPYKFTFVLDAADLQDFVSDEAELQLVLAATTAKSVTLTGSYTSTTFGGDMTGNETAVQNLRNVNAVDDILTLSGTRYQVVTVPFTDAGTSITTLPFIGTLTLSGTGYDYSKMDLKYSEAKDIVIDGDFAANQSTATIMLPDRVPEDSTTYTRVNRAGLDVLPGDTITFNGGVTTNPITLNLYGSKELKNITFDSSTPANLGTSLKTLDISTPYAGAGNYPPQLEVQPEITGWTYAPDKELLVKDTAIKEFHSFKNQNTPMYPEDVTLIDIRNIYAPSQLERLEIPTGDYQFGSGTPVALTTLKYKAGHDQTLKYLTLNGQNQIGTTGGSAAATISSTFSKDDDSGLVPGTPLAALEEVQYNELTQLVQNPVDVIDIDLSDNKIRIFEMSNCTPPGAPDGNGVTNLNLSGNQFAVIENKNPTSVGGNGLWCVNTPILGTIDFSKNNLTKVSLDGTQSVSITGGTRNLGSTINLSDQLNTISIPELSTTPFGNISDGVTILNIDSLVTLDVRYDKITGFDLKDLVNLKYIEGAAHHSFATITTPQLLIAGRASFYNAGPNLWAPAGASGAKKELNFEGHAITYLTIKNMGDFDVLNFRRQNSTGDVAPKAEQGALQTVNLVAGTGGDIDTLDVSFNSIERVDNAGGALLSGTMNYTGVTFTGNAVVNADYNNISKVNIKGTQFVSGADTLKTLRMNDNLLIDLTYTDSASLEKLLVNRSVTGRNTFANGNVILTNASALEAFAPATSVAADKTEDAQFNRIKPVVPSESRWAQDSPGGITPQFADFTNLPSGTFGSEFGFYHSVPITTLDISGATSMTTLRVPGHYLTNSSMNSAGTGNIEFLDLSGSPYLTTDATGALYAGTSTTKSRGGKYTTINVRSAGTQDTNSGQLTGVFVGQWPKLQSLYIQNNQIQQLDVGTSTNLVHILAYQNQLGQGLTSDAVKVTTATALTVLDVERNPNIRVLAVPTQNLEILRAGLAGLTAYPNVHNITTLKQLYVDHNNLSGDAEEVAGNPNLEVLNISANNFTTLPNVSSLANLEEYYAYNNQAKSLGDFNNSGKLAILDVSDNLIEAWPTLPSSIVYLDLSRNRFGGVLDIPGIPAGISRSTPYTVKAHEVTALEGVTDKGAVYAQTDDFYGTFAIEDNQITALPEALKNAYTDMINNVSGRLVYRMFVNWNVLDIDVYGLDSSGNPVAAYTGTQKWVAAYPGVKATLLNFVYDDKLKMVLEGSVGLYDPRSGLPVEDINGFEAPYTYQQWEYGWEDTLGLVYGEKIDRDGVALGKVRIIDNLGRNGRAIIGVTLYGPQMNTNSIKEWNEDGTKTVDGSQDSGQVLDDLKGNNANYNPATGALGAEE